ncbi:hypothetical protein ACQP2E_10190 [Actinoplanes sp. CA-015351]|uniref:hypothetical protein n=1 Tax=Actinoplanes sp. CA-015351 TaxID=3239897 RepID=UPI003D95A097
MPILNFAAQSDDPANRGLAVNGNYWRVYGVVVERAGDNGIFLGGSNNVLERTITRFNRDTGLQLSRILSTTPNSQWPANNLVRSAESHDNADSDGEDADSTNQVWSGSNGSRCSAYTGVLAWSYASNGALVVTIGGVRVTLQEPCAACLKSRARSDRGRRPFASSHSRLLYIGSKHP